MRIDFKWFSLACRNAMRNRRRSLTTLLAMIIGVVTILLFGGYSRNITYGLQTGYVLRGGHLQVQDDAALASVEDVEVLAFARHDRGGAPDAIPGRRLDLYDVRSEVGEVQAAVGPGDDLRHLEHTHAIQWSGHHPPSHAAHRLDSRAVSRATQYHGRSSRLRFAPKTLCGVPTADRVSAKEQSNLRTVSLRRAPFGSTTHWDTAGSSKRDRGNHQAAARQSG